jgi:phage shock protein C
MNGESTVRRLKKSRTSRVIDGVCGGMGEYFGIDPVIVRVIFVASILLGGLGAVLYLALMIIMPAARPAELVPVSSAPLLASGTSGAAGAASAGAGGTGDPAGVAGTGGQAAAGGATGTGVRANSRGPLIGGVLLVVLGILLLLKNVGVGIWHFWWGAPWDITLSLFLIGAGVAFILMRREKAPAEGGTSQPPPTSRLTRPRTGRKLFGVCAGLAAYVNVDPTIVRILFVIAGLASIGFMLIAYLLLTLVVPSDDPQPVQATA